MLAILTSEDDILLGGGVNSALLADAEGNLIDGFEYRVKGVTIVSDSFDGLIDEILNVGVDSKLGSTVILQMTKKVQRMAELLGAETIRQQDENILLADVQEQE